MESEAIEGLKTSGRFHEIYKKVFEFKGYRPTKEGGESQQVIFDIYHGGAIGSPPQYHCEAKTDTGHSSMGPSAPTIATAIAIFHWGELG